jgi:hypothetical protein
MKQKSQQEIWRSRCTLNWGKKNLKKSGSPISMKNGKLNTSKYRGKLQKMELLYTHSPRSPGPFPKLPNFFYKKITKYRKRRTKHDRASINPRAKAGPLAAGQHLPCQASFLFFWNFFPHALHFLRMWSTLASWLQHMPALPRLLLKTSNTHNFWFIAPKIMKFVLTRSLLSNACGSKFLNSKNNVRSCDAAQIRFGPHRTSSSFRG